MLGLKSNKAGFFYVNKFCVPIVSSLSAVRQLKTRYFDL